MLPYDPDDQELKAMFHVTSHEQQGVEKSVEQYNSRKGLHGKIKGVAHVCIYHTNDGIESY